MIYRTLKATLRLLWRGIETPPSFRDNVYTPPTHPPKKRQHTKVEVTFLYASRNHRVEVSAEPITRGDHGLYAVPLRQAPELFRHASNFLGYVSSAMGKTSRRRGQKKPGQNGCSNRLDCKVLHNDTFSPPPPPDAHCIFRPKTNPWSLDTFCVGQNVAPSPAPGHNKHNKSSVPQRGCG